MTGPAKRMTPQKSEVREALRDASGFVSAQALHSTLVATGSRIGLATVYRALNELVDAGTADTLQSPSGETLFRGCATSGHHHHLICRQCGTAVEVHSDAVEEWARASAREHGFVDVGHVLDIYGLCSTCAAHPALSLDSPSQPFSG
jgi:Fur family ferric uptake transcriptional regulator